jgi:SP family arabinose:H+ symporter-like MFS transporter
VWLAPSLAKNSCGGHLNPLSESILKTKQLSQLEAIDRNRRNRYIFAVAFVAAIGGFLFGFDLSLIGAANIYLKDQFHLTEEMLGFTSASAALGCVFGPFLGGWLSDKIGRERTMMLAALLLAAGAIMTAIAPDIFLFNAFRIVGGVGIGICSVASPLYIAEIAPAKMRGKLGLTYQLAIVVGSTAAPLAAYAILQVFPEATAWRWMFASQMAVIVLFIPFLFLIPPSPRWLADRGRFDDALDVLRKVHGDEVAADELDEIKASLSTETGGFRELIQPGIRYALLIGILLAFFNNWTGWSSMASYIPILFEMAGVAQRHIAILQFSFTYLAMALVTLASMWMIDRFGRRPLWIFASLLMAGITGVTGLVFAFQIKGAFLLLVIILCTVPHGLALGALPWLMMSEIFPNRVRAKAVAVTTTFLWLMIFSAAQFFPMLIGGSQRMIGSPAGAFWLFSLICMAAALFGWRMMPETKGRSLENIADSWRRH